MTPTIREICNRLKNMQAQVNDLTRGPAPVLIWVHEEHAECDECRNRNGFGRTQAEDLHGRVVKDHYHESGCIFATRFRPARSDDDSGDYFDRDGNWASDRVEELVNDV